MDAAALHRDALVLDAIVDTSTLVMYGEIRLEERNRRGRVDIPRMRDGGVDAAVFYVSAEETYLDVTDLTQPPVPGRQIVEPVFSGPALVKRVLREIDALHEAVARNPGTLSLARNAAEVARSVAAGKIAVVLGLNAGWIDEDLSILRSYHLLGLRVMALCHDAALSWADSEMEYRPGGPGLTEFGRSVVREMNRLGIIVDVSHASDQTVRDVLAVSSQPVIASHSGCRSLCAVRRNLPDDLIRGIADAGGVIGVSYVAWLLDEEFSRADLSCGVAEDVVTISRGLRARYSDPFDLALALRKPAITEALLGGRPPRQRPRPPSIDALVRHIRYLVDLVGEDHVALGSEYDGVYPPEGLEDISSTGKVR